MDVQKMRDYIQKWIVDLRSGKYAQSQGIMKKSDGCFCALGLLCDQFARDGIGEWKLVDNNRRYHYECTVDDHVQVSACWLIWDHTTAFNEIFGGTNFQNKITRMNDSGKTFGEIADLVEQMLKRGV